MTDFPGRAHHRRVVMGGQSMNFIPAAPYDVPTRVGRITGYIIDTTPAHGGEGWEVLMGAERLAELEAACTNDRTILVMNGGQGDILDLSGRTAAECYDLATTYAGLARGYGYWKVVGVAWPSVANTFYSFITQAMIDVWLEVAELTAANTDDLYDAVADCSTSPFDDPQDLDIFAVDRLHLDYDGGAIMGDRIGAAVLTL